MLTAAAAIGILQLAPGGSTALRPLAAAAATDVTAQQTLINQDRANAGLPPVQWSPCLGAIAVQNAQRMVRQGYISHTNGPELDLACGIGSTRQAGENVAYISSGIDDPTANTMFMNSAPHRANILGSYGYVGTSWAVASNGYAYLAVEFLGASSAVVPSGFHPLPPTRIVDTRNGTGGVPIGRMVPGETLTVQVAGRGGIPATGVASVVLNVTVADTTGPGFLTVYPAEDPRPNSSNLNWLGWQVVPNLVEVALHDSGQLSIYNHVSSSTNVIFDVAGYVPTTTATPGPDGLFNPLVPARILDTRSGIGGFSAPLGPGATMTFQLAGRGGVPAAGASAVVINLTAINTTASSFVTAYPAGISRPNASNLNFVAGQLVPNRVVVKLGVNGQVSLYNLTGTVDLVADVNGWFTDGTNVSTGSSFTGVTPARILDTRDGTGGFNGPVFGGSTIMLPVAGFGGVPEVNWITPPAAVVLNVTVTNGTVPSFLRVYPSDANPVPSTSDLNWTPGRTIPNLVVVKPGADGKIGIYNLAGATDVIVDVLGWYG